MRYLILFIFLFKLEQVKSQQVSAILKRLYLEPRGVQISTYNNQDIINIPDLPDTYNNSGQSITKTSKGVFVNPLGTGRIYQLKGSNDSLYWYRIDSTIFFGYNFGSFFFSLDSTLYSFAGQGFFNHNGNLRYFNEKSSKWNAKNLSESIFWLTNHNLFESIDTAKRQLYIEALSLKQDHALKERLVPDMYKMLWKLDIDSGDWIKLGKINKEMSTVGETSFGTLVNFNMIVDLNKNKIYRLSQKLTDRIFSIVGNSTNPKEITHAFCIDSTLYMGDRFDFIDSVLISKNDLIETNEIFYTPIEKEVPLKERHVFIGLIASLGLVTSFLFYKIKNNKIPQVSNSQNNSVTNETTVEANYNQVVFRSGKLMDLLNEREKILLSFIYEHSLEERLTTIDEINRVIGASQRNPEVQKRLRSDLIGTINDKLEIIAESKSSVIDKQRSDFDKRSFEYFIRPEHMQLVEKVLGKKG